MIMNEHFQFSISFMDMHGYQFERGRPSLDVPNFCFCKNKLFQFYVILTQNIRLLSWIKLSHCFPLLDIIYKTNLRSLPVLHSQLKRSPPQSKR